MDWFSGIVVFVMIWWVVLFTVLPWGIELDESGPEVSGPGAPKNPKLGKKFLITTLISILLWGIVYALIAADFINFREMARMMSKEDAL